MAVTPSFPLPPMPTGKSTDLPTPGPSCHSLLIAARCVVKTNVVPLESARRTTVTFVSGSLRSGLALAISGSFHFLTLPRKMPV